MVEFALKKLYVVGNEFNKGSFDRDFYDHVLKNLGFDAYILNSVARYYFHLLWHKYDLIWACSNSRGFITILLKRFPLLKQKMKNTKVITRFHREIHARFTERPEVAWMPYMSVVGSDKVVWVYNCFNELITYVPKISRRVFSVVHNGIDLDYYKPDEAKRVKHTIFTVSGWHSPKKRLEVLIEAMNYLPKWRLDIAGRFLQDDYETKCKALAKPNKDRIYFHGFVKEKLNWMQKAEVFVMPSRQESWSTQVMEAMACECFVIAPKIGGIPQYVPENELVSTEVSAKELAAKIEHISDEKALRTLNRTKIEPYSWKNVRQETKDVLNGWIT